MRHYSKVFVELPDGPSDPPFAVVTVECDVCGEEEIRIHVSHIGTLLRTLTNTVESLDDDGHSESFVAKNAFIPSDTANKKKVRDYLNSEFPGWKAERLRRS